MTQDQQETLNEIFLGKEDPDMAFKKPMTNNLKELRKEIEEKLIDMWLLWERGDWYAQDGQEDKYNDRGFRDAINDYILNLINQKEKELLEKVEEAIGEDERLRLQATPSTMTLGEAKNQWRQELRDRIKQLKEEREYQEYKKAEEKRIYDIEHDYVRPTPPSQIEEEPRLNEPGKIIPYKTFRGKRYVDLDWLLKELEAINKLTKE